jgi:neurofibromin 1
MICFAQTSQVVVQTGTETLVLGGSSDVQASLRVSLQGVFSRFQLSAASATIGRRTLRPADVPGTLLNMALLNLGSANPALRLSA